MNDTKEVPADVADLSAVVAHDDGDAEPQVYELGYHLLPTLEEGAVEAHAAKVRDALSKEEVEVVGERAPAKIKLAYAIETTTGGTRRQFDSAYFGWVAFATLPKTVAAVEAALKQNENVLRFILVKTSRDAVAATLADPLLDVASPEVEPSGDDLDEALNTIEKKRVYN